MALEPARITDFAIAGTLGSGATARVFEATHIATGRAVAIKVLEPGAQGPELRERFAREALLLSNIKSRHIGQILGFGFERGQPFLVLERLVGETLDAKLRRDGPVRPPQSLDWVEQLLVGVRDVHAANVVHRDLKPANIFLQIEGGRETVKVIDFGIARLNDITQGGHGLTSPNHLLGSMGYMAPEAFRSARAVGFATDLYAVGVVIFRMVSGQLPFVSRSLETLIRMKTDRDAPILSSIEGAPRVTELDAFVARALDREPKSRFSTAREMLEAWQRVRAIVASPAPRLTPRGYDVEDIATNVDLQKVAVGALAPEAPFASLLDESTTRRQLASAFGFANVPRLQDDDDAVPRLHDDDDMPADDGTTAQRDLSPAVRAHQAALAAASSKGKAASGAIPATVGTKRKPPPPARVMPNTAENLTAGAASEGGGAAVGADTDDIEVELDDEPAASILPNSGRTVVGLPSFAADADPDWIDTAVNKNSKVGTAPPPADLEPSSPGTPSTRRGAAPSLPGRSVRKKPPSPVPSERAPKTVVTPPRSRPDASEAHEPTSKAASTLHPTTERELPLEGPAQAQAPVDLGELVKAALERQRALKKKRV